METNEQGAFLVPPGEGKKPWATDELMTFKASGEDTSGAAAGPGHQGSTLLVEYPGPAGSCPHNAW